MASGSPATELYTFEEMGIYPDTHGRFWFEGTDSDYFMHSFGPKRATSTSADRPHFWFELKTETARPLPAGDYTVRPRKVDAFMAHCTSTLPVLGDVTTELTVTAPTGTVYEAMFDTATVGNAVQASIMLKPYTAAGADTSTITSVSWRSGTLKIEMDPVTAHVGKYIDFIDVDGELALPLKLVDATVDATAKTLSWSVADAPWEAGDKMMLRIYEKVASTCTVAEGAMMPGACYGDLAFASSSYGFTVYDVAAGSSVGSVSVNFPDPDLVTLSIISGDDNGHFAISATGEITTAKRLDHGTTSSYTLTVQADAGSWSRATAEVAVTVSPVTVTLSPREDEFSTGTEITIEWSAPDDCAASQYFVGVYNNEELYRAERPLGLHPAPATTTISADLGLSWDRVPDYDWWVGVTCASSSGWTVFGKAPLQSGLPRPEVAIADLGGTLANGSSDGFTADASNLDADTSYTIRVTTDDADLGFDTGCTDRQEEVTVAASSTSHTASLTLYGCGAPGGTVTVTLLSGKTTVHTATQDVTVPNTAAMGAPTVGGTVQAGQGGTAARPGSCPHASRRSCLRSSYRLPSQSRGVAGGSRSQRTIY